MLSVIKLAMLMILLSTLSHRMAPSSSSLIPVVPSQEFGQSNFYSFDQKTFLVLWQMLPSTNYYPVILLSVITKVFEKLVIGLLITNRNVTSFLISSVVLGLLDQLQLYLIGLLGFLIGLGLHELYYLIYPKLLTGFGELFFFTTLSLMECQVTIWLYFFFSQ